LSVLPSFLPVRSFRHLPFSLPPPSFILASPPSFFLHLHPFHLSCP
jgi:hypothetical protein